MIGQYGNNCIEFCKKLNEKIDEHLYEHHISIITKMEVITNTNMTQETIINWEINQKSNDVNYSIICEDGSYISIIMADKKLTEREKDWIDKAFTHLYYTSSIIQNARKEHIGAIGIFVRNGFHFDDKDVYPHITFNFRYYNQEGVERTPMFHAYFDLRTRLINRLTRIEELL